MRNWVMRARLAGWCLLGGSVAVQQAFLVGAEIPRSPTPPMDSAEVWVERLGNSDFIERQRAMERLSEIGKTAVEPLRKALASEDAEVRFRARYLLRLIRESHRASSIEAFLAGDTADASDELPGWPKFREITGTRPDARQLYAQMLQDEGAFLDSVYEAEIPQSARLLSRRTWELHQDLRNGRAVSVSSVGALLLVASDNQIDLASQTGMMSLCYRTEFDRAIRGGPLQQPLRALLGRVVAKNSDESMLAQRLHFSLHYDLPEGLEPARQVLANRGGLPHIRQYAVLVVAKLGKEEVDDQLLQRTLDDPAEVAAMHRIDRRQISTQVRDIALAALVHRSRQPFSDYGLADVRRDATLMFQTASVGFESEEAREKAMESWKNRDPNKLPTNSPFSPDSNSDTDAPPGESTEANKAEISPE